jgi:hypothetical protein
MSKPLLHSSTEAVLKKILDTSARGTSTLGYMHLAFLFGMKVGAYLSFRRVNIMASSLTHEEIYCLGGTTEDILEKIGECAVARGVDIEAIIKERLQEAKAGRSNATLAMEDLQEKLEEARVTYNASTREEKFLEDMLKELTKKEKP